MHVHGDDARGLVRRRPRALGSVAGSGFEHPNGGAPAQCEDHDFRVECDIVSECSQSRRDLNVVLCR